MKRTRLTGGTVIGALGAIVLTATASFGAATGHPISGTCYEDGSWFTSSNVRTMGSTYISASFNSVPTKGLAVRTMNYNTGAGLGGIIDAPPLGTQVIASGHTAGTMFVNSFRLETAGRQAQYSFDGSENY